MKASVIVPSRGGAERLPRLLDALSRQTYESWEAVIVLDGDIDGSASVVERYSHLPVQVLVFPENRGRVAALNAGFAAADGDVLYRALAGLGTLITLGGDFRQKMKSGISGTLHLAGAKPAAQRQDTQELLAEIRDELR